LDAKVRQARSVIREAARIKRGATASPPSASTYEGHRERAAARQAELSESGRDIGDLPAVVDPQRKAAAAASFKEFCDTYFPATFCLPWSDDHLRVIAKIEAAVLGGELFAVAMPRGSGKTSLVEIAALWALLFGYRDFVAIIGADEEHARTMLESIKVECETNDLLADDFPEAIYPIVRLEKIHQRAKGQLYAGKPTNIEWTSNEVQFPAIPGSKAAGGIIRVAGITGRIRGMSAKRAADGRKARPSLVLIDDPQTDESASSPSQVATREAVLKGAVLGLAGPGAKIAGLCTVTVVKPDDLADRLLDRKRHPAWQGERTKLVYQWPNAEELWSQYAEMRRDGQRLGTGTAAATDFYRQSREAMDVGAKVAWEERKNEDELSAIQHAWNLRIDRGDVAFASEFQNEPLLDEVTTDKLDKRQLAARATTLAYGTVPANHHRLTAFVDVQDRVLFWLVASWSDQFGGHVVQYGVYPDQGVTFFDASAAKRTLAAAANGAGFEAALTAGLERVTEMLLAKEWGREDGTAMRISQMMIDANWGKSTQTVRTFAKRSPFATLILPSHGRGIGASSPALNDRHKARGDRLGLNWRIGNVNGQRSITYDTNFWKTFVASRLRLPTGDPEAVVFHAGDHDLLFEHLTTEYPIRTESARGRVVDEWRLSGNRFENHWWDCLVGSAVAASVAGLQPSGTEIAGRARRKAAIPTTPGGGKRIQIRKLGE